MHMGEQNANHYYEADRQLQVIYRPLIYNKTTRIVAFETLQTIICT